MSNSGLDTPWDLILTDDPFGSDMVDVSPVTRKWLDVPYDDKSPSQVLDIYLPEEGEGPFPAYIFVHGGMFLLGDKQDMQFMLAIDGVNRGYAVISLEYRRALETKAPAALYDVKAALRFLRAHAAEYRLDPERFALGGDSAGAYYAVFTAATEGIAAFDGPDPANAGVSSHVSAVIAECGVYDPGSIAPDPELEAADPTAPFNGGLPRNLMTGAFGVNPNSIPDIIRLINPITYITKDFPPAFIQAGTEDMFIPCTESESLCRAITERCGADRVRCRIFEGWNHCATGHILTPGFFMAENMDRIFGFLDEVM